MRPTYSVERLAFYHAPGFCGDLRIETNVSVTAERRRMDFGTILRNGILNFSEIQTTLNFSEIRAVLNFSEIRSILNFSEIRKAQPTSKLT